MLWFSLPKSPWFKILSGKKLSSIIFNTWNWKYLSFQKTVVGFFRYKKKKGKSFINVFKSFLLLLFVSSCFWSNEKLRVGWPVGYLLTRFLHFLLFGEKQATFGQDDDATNYDQFWKILPQNCTLTDSTLSCPGSLLKTTPPPPGYPWVSGGQYVTPEPRFSGLVIDHQGLEEL